MSEPSVNEPSLTPQQARDLLGSVPARPRRTLTRRDHLGAAATILLSLASGVLALAGHPLWAIGPALAALIVANAWLSGRRARVNEPRLGSNIIILTVFTVWLLLPIWRGITRGDTAPFPEALALAALAPAAWLALYLVLALRR